MVALSISSVSAALAQTPAPTAVAAADDADAGTITVTGSRLKRDPNSTAPLPISTITSDQLRAAGNTDPTATLRQIPALLASGTVADSIERGAGGIGQATLNLRQLGANRTLVLVDGNRHVSGVVNTQAVDVSTIPNALIERVEVLTGGASAIYGADAVTGVVNYILKKDFDGVALDAQSGIASRGDAQSYRIEGTIGKNFAEGRGNITFSAGYTNDAEVLMGQRETTANNGRGNNNLTYGNPDRFFQRGQIDAATMPNFASRFRIGGPGPATTRFPFGAPIPTLAQFNSFFPGVTPTAAELALINSATAAPTNAIRADSRFSISSNSALIFRSDFRRFNLDINRNGTPDCDESYIGRTGFGGGGCYIATDNSGVKVYQDGVIAGPQNAFGGDGQATFQNGQSLTPASERIYANFRGGFEISPAARVFVDAKYARNNTVSRNPYNTFYDTLQIFPDNPFIPALLQSEANAGGGLRVSRDFVDMGPGITTANRDTYRIVGGVEGEITSNLRYNITGNYGRTDNSTTFSNSVRYDRFFAAIDVVRSPTTGQPICRSDISSTPYPGSETFPLIRPGFFTFKPGDGSCRPANLFNGQQSVSQAAIDFITTPTTTKARLEQTVITGTLNGDTGTFLSLPGGAVQFAMGAEYRKEKSRQEFDPLRLGLLPANSPAGAAGTFVGSLPPITVPGFPIAASAINQSLVFDATTRVVNTSGQFDVKEAFGEISLPILKDRPFFHDLTIDAAGRYADYSTVGGAFTWNVSGVWAPVQDIRFRGTYSKAIRAPNIGELFDPKQGTTFTFADPCDSAALAAFVAGGGVNATNRQTNCRADVGANFVDTRTGRISGTTGGDPNLDPERATTWTIGAVIQPRFVPGLTLSADYYSIRINDAIQAVTAQNIVNTCYDLQTFPNSFCGQFTRNRTPGTGFQNINFLNQTQINFARLETAGVDFQADYRFALGSNNFDLRLGGNWTERVNRFFDPVRTDLVNPALGELSVPEWSGTGSASWNRGAFSLTYNLQYVGSTGAASAVEIENLNLQFGPAGLAPAYWIHGVSFNFDVVEKISFYGGVNNLTDAEPYISSSAYPVSGVGRFLFVGVRARY